MCGIVGIFDPTRTGRADPTWVQRMVQALIHRGPDGEGAYAWPPAAPNVALGVRRLSIIDLATGDQPVFNEDRSIALVFNGEIFNYPELRAELERRGHRLRSRGDTETIVHLYEDHGVDFFHHLRGMYAFALWDSRQERLVLAVDRVGIKPLYVTESQGRVFFASEVKALLAVPSIARRVDPTGIDTYLTFGYTVGEESLFEGISRIPPGHALVLQGTNSRKIEHALDSPTEPLHFPNETDAIDEVHDRLLDSVRVHLRSDVTVGLFLSGGVDSASVLALASQTVPGPIEAFTVGFERRDDETAPAARLAAHFGAVHHSVNLSPDAWWNDLLAATYEQDEPNADPAVPALSALAQAASGRVKAVLSGFGGDEVFYGYALHRRVPALLRRAERIQRRTPGLAGAIRRWRLWDGAEALYPTARRVPLLGRSVASLVRLHNLTLPRSEAMRRMLSYEGLILTDRLRQKLYTGSLQRISVETRARQAVFQQLVDRTHADDLASFVQRVWMRTWLPGSGLLGLDKVTMAHSLEARVPFFDAPLDTFLQRIPPSLHMKGDKYLLRRAMQRHLPDFALRRRKRPFAIPLRPWLLGPLKERVREVLLDPHARSRGWFDPHALESTVRQTLEGQTDQTEVVFRLLVFELWQQATIDAAPHVPRPEPDPTT